MTRLDQALVDRGLCESRERAKRAILAGQVRVNTQLAHKPSDAVQPNDALAVEAGEKYVSRGGHKLEHALRHFQLDATGLVALDLGASTGGFTDCLLQHGATRVFAVDVGQGQLAWKLRHDRRVVVMEKTNARFLTPEQFGGTSHTRLPSSNHRTEAGARIARPSEHIAAFTGIDLIVIDCSFISLRKILPAAIALLKPNGKIVALIKPQFEAGKAEADKGRGVINDPAVHERVVNELRQFVAAQSGWNWRGVSESPLLGPAGNREFFVLIEKAS
ncbi:MAG TPA: TlyA family RNA methyltransferase [Candidatus Sulfopaludibacter sp.]|nr:TlyA family RNA methyltransferase [Candidatus Sulfopaludibacter sp.]